MQGRYQEISSDEAFFYWRAKLSQPHLRHRLLGILQSVPNTAHGHEYDCLPKWALKPNMLHLRHQCHG